jgi:hypothetical protein
LIALATLMALNILLIMVVAQAMRRADQQRIVLEANSRRDWLWPVGLSPQSPSPGNPAATYNLSPADNCLWRNVAFGARSFE